MTDSLSEESKKAVEAFEAYEGQITIELKMEALKGNTIFKDLWIGNGWLSKDKNGTVSFTTVKD